MIREYPLDPEPVPSLLKPNFRILSGHQYWDDNVLKFPTEGKPQNFYITSSGSMHGAFIYVAKTDANLSMCAMRFSRVRRDTLWDAWLTHSQMTVLPRLRRDYVQILLNHITINSRGYRNSVTELLENYDKPHPKREARVRATLKLIDNFCVNHDVPYMKRVNGNLKIEMLGLTKLPRMVVDMGVEASLQGFVLTEVLKEALAKHSVFYNDVEVIFCKTARSQDLQAALSALLLPAKRCTFVVFSDDGALAIRENGRIRHYNVDISKCDASHTVGAWDALLGATPADYREEVRKLIDQLRTPMKIISTVNRAVRTTIQYDGIPLYSGSVLTTLINTFVMHLIGFEFSREQVHDATSIKAAASNLGYMLTVQNCEDIPDIQFLKHSPVWTDQGWRFILNFAVFARIYGRWKGDFPGRGKIEHRAKAVNASYVQSMFPRFHTPLIDYIRKNCGKPNQKITDQITKANRFKYNPAKEQLAATDFSYFHRYNFTSADYATLYRFFAEPTGNHLSGGPATKLFRKDYEYEW